MKTSGMFVLIILLTCSSGAAAQSDTAFAGRRALVFADSLIQAFHSSHWAHYLELSYPGVVHYYGGKQGFLEYLRRSRAVTGDLPEEKPEKIELVQLHSDRNEWQCVVRKTRNTRIDDRPADVISYMVGQSKDGGRNWKYFDVAYNSAENVIYIMPDIFSTLTIPRRQIIFLQNNAKVAR